MRTVIALKRNGEKIAQSELDNWDQMKTEKAYQEYKSKRKEKPWLKTVPQSVPASRAYRDLCRFAGVSKPLKRLDAKPKEKKLPKIPNDHTREFMINGYVVSVRQLAKLLDMRYEVVDSKLRRGVTPEALLKKKGVKL
ncbi:hypothetical protein [Staphylococcus agnetis]|uniref:Uncharacterized protein n=1 Tax=Staphylococcus agnetis TaxID=985762 RepID=A0ABX3Z2K9_9STAP|nr:hypothetical protein [Staphylococcus agnetis]OSP20410.1 hypothetical protein B9L42_05490 [Staphylococcus agnetis]OSP25147.1 hypothetical protein B9M87_00935 [Staphylococcus agnetis]OTW31172.1 hypothetical protein B9M88_06865 [Staphylococcus agnetis]